MVEAQKKKSSLRRLLHSVKKGLKNNEGNQASAGQPASRPAPGAYTAVRASAPPAPRAQGPTTYMAPGPFHSDVIAAANRTAAPTPHPVFARPSAPTPPQPPASAPPMSPRQDVPQDWKAKQAEEWARKKVEVDALWAEPKKADATAPAPSRRWTMAEMKDAQEKSKYVGHRDHTNPVLQDMMRARFTKDHTIPEHTAKDKMDL